MTTVPVLYDTGSNILSLFKRDLMEMATQETLDQYRHAGFSHVLHPDGVVSVFRKLWVEYRFCNPDDGETWYRQSDAGPTVSHAGNEYQGFHAREFVMSGFYY